MKSITLKIIIKPLPGGQFQVKTDIPHDARVAFISGHLENISNGLKQKVNEKIEANNFNLKQDAIDFANSLTIKDLL